MVILCETKEKAEETLRRIGLILEHLGLGINAEKTRIVYVGDGKAGFDFLGFHFRNVESWRYRGRRYAQMWPARKAMKAIRGRIKEITAPRWKLAQGIFKIVKELNPVIRGWGNYFRIGHSTRCFYAVSQYLYEQLALYDSKRRGKAGRRWETHDNTWQKSLGVVSLRTQWLPAVS